MATQKGTSEASAQATDSGRVRDPKQRAVDSWLQFPPGARKFIIDNPNKTEFTTLDVPALIDFWSSPQNIPCTRGQRARRLSEASWYLALLYLKMGMRKESQALIMNGSFIHQCHESSIEYVSSASERGVNIPCHKLLHLRRGVDSLRSAKKMESFLRSRLPPEDTRHMTSYSVNFANKNSMGYVDQISEDWNATSSASKGARRRSSPNDNETRIKLILVDDSDGDNKCSLDIGSSTALKALFNEYADKRGISLRSLRFFFKGKTLFLSNAGRKTPEELGLRDNDVIVVHDASNSNDDPSPGQGPAPSKKTEAKKRSTNKKTKTKRKGKERRQREEPGKTPEEDKVEHSKRLTKIHGEAHDRFRRIRQRLNNLVIERSQPKIKSKCPRSPKDAPPLPSAVNGGIIDGLGGKAGKSRYAIQVGEVKNLYKTTKPPAIASSLHRSPNDTSHTLDLHGCTREEAMARLDGALEAWADAAMRGSYPFVLPATIVCGCGNQILSETVQEWIRSNDRVSNAPKVRARPSKR